jgi:hypothetical protein
MTRKVVISILFILLVVFAGNASARYFVGHLGGGDAYWGTFGSWTDDGATPAAPPTAAMTATVINVPGYGPTINAAGAVAATVAVGDWGWNGSLTVTSAGVLTTPLLGLTYTGLTGTITNSGTINVTGTGWVFNCGSGSNLINMNGGAINVTGDFRLDDNNGTSHINLYGGTITAGTFQLAGNGNHTMDITAGTLISGGDLTGGLDYMTGPSCLITAYGGWGEVEYSFNGSTTTVTATPTYINASARTVAWDTLGGNRQWDRAMNWYSGSGSMWDRAVPRAVDNALISWKAVDANSPILGTGQAADVNDVFIGNDAVDAVKKATLTVAGGTLDCNTLYLGKASASDDVNRPAHLQLDAGTINAVAFDGNPEKSSIDIEAGVLILTGNYTLDIEYLVSLGKITAYGGDGCISADYNVGTGKTTVRASDTVLLGDFNADCTVDLDDLMVMAGNWLKNSTN